MGRGRLHLRHLRRLLLQGPEHHGRGGRRLGDRGGAVPGPPRPQGGGRPPARHACALRRSCRSAPSRIRKIEFLWNRVVEDILDPAQGKVTAVRLRDIGHRRAHRARRGRSLRGHRSRAEHAALPGPASTSCPTATSRSCRAPRRRRVPGVFAAGDVAGSRLPPGGDRRRHRLHGRAGGRALPRERLSPSPRSRSSTHATPLAGPSRYSRDGPRPRETRSWLPSHERAKNRKCRPMQDEHDLDRAEEGAVAQAVDDAAAQPRSGEHGGTEARAQQRRLARDQGERGKARAPNQVHDQRAAGLGADEGAPAKAVGQEEWRDHRARGDHQGGDRAGDGAERRRSARGEP